MSRAEAKPAVRVAVATETELPSGARRVIDVKGRSIGVFNVNGEYFALRNRCPHQGAPLCEGLTTGLAKAVFRDGEAPVVTVERDGEIVRCPWHAWEFDMRTGHAVFGEGWRVAVYRAYLDRGEEPPGQGDDVDVPPPVETFKTEVEAGMVYVEIPA